MQECTLVFGSDQDKISSKSQIRVDHASFMDGGRNDILSVALRNKVLQHQTGALEEGLDERQTVGGAVRRRQAVHMFAAGSR